MILKIEHFKKPITIFIVMLSLSLGLTSSISPQVSAQDKQLCGGANLKLTAETCPTNNQSGLNKLITAIVKVLSVIVGIAAVVMIIIGGFKFITSAGDSGKVTSAKQTIIYAIVGLIIVALAQIIVRFILNKV